LLSNHVAGREREEHLHRQLPTRIEHIDDHDHDQSTFPVQAGDERRDRWRFLTGGRESPFASTLATFHVASAVVFP
jgi:hypothetical protein